MKRILLCSSFGRLVVLITLFSVAMCSKAVTFNVSPAGTSNTYTGFITLQANGLSTGETVVIRKYLDLNSNGIVEPSDYFVQQCQIQDGQGPTLIGGATNINIPYDRDVADGAITTTIPMANVGIIHRFAGQYLYVLSSPSNHFASITNTFVVSNPSTGQTITGTVFSNSIPVPYAAVLVGTAADGDFNPITGTIANASGVYSINVTPDTYMAVPLESNNVGIPAGPIVVASGTTVTNDLTLVAANATISGQVVDSANATIPLVGLLMSAQGNGFATSVTDTNGNFSLGVTTGSQWKIDGDDGGWNFLGYVSSNNHPKINVSGNINGVQLSYPKGDAMFYGRVLDSNNQPLVGVRLFGQSDNGGGAYQGDATTDPNGQYAMSVVDGNWDIGVDVGSLGSEFRGYIFSQAPFAYSNGGGGTNLAPNSSVQQDFVAVLATNTISGYLRDGSSNGISGVQVIANAIINGIGFSAQATTDSSGFYSINVGNGSWFVFVNCCDGCNNGLPSGYQCPNSRNVNISNNDQVVDFTAITFTTFLSGRVSDEFGNAISNMNIFAFADEGSSFGATTDNGGMYTIGLVGGSYTVQLNTDASSGAPSLGLVSPSILATIPDNTTVSNFNLFARHISGTIVGAITNGDNGQPVAGVYVSANATIGGTNYTSGVQLTSAGGSTTLGVCNGTWSVGVDCFGLSAQNLSCAPNQNATVSGNSVPVTFIVHGAGTVTPPGLSHPSRTGPGQFQFHLNGTPGQNYTLQYATTLTNWSTFLITNPSSPDVIILDSNATTPTRAYRALVGP